MKAILVAGLGFGDEGKGSIVDSLVRETKASLVVRFHGGAQAAHNVVLKDGREHCFSQFGSGTLAGARTHLSRFMLIDPTALLNESLHLKSLGIENPFELMTINPDAPIITPYHRIMNQLREISRGDKAHGSCGIGIGELASDILNKRPYLKAKDVWCHNELVLNTIGQIQKRFSYEVSSLHLRWSDNVSYLLAELRKSSYEWLKRVWEMHNFINLSSLPQMAETTVFEGAQGILLDEKYGFAPHTTWSNCTFDNALTLLRESDFEGDVEKIGVIRSYLTRHGNGPFPSEDHINIDLSKEHNRQGKWQGSFRIGCFDSNLFHYAVKCLKGLDSIAITHMDQFRTPWPILSDDNFYTVRDSEEFLSLIEKEAPVKIISSGPTEKDKSYL
jgi:adenylosuccinate synthase